MLIVLHGGLGNQLFQVSVGAALADVTTVHLTQAHTSLGARPCEVDNLARHLGLEIVDKPCPRGHQSGEGPRSLSAAVDGCCGVYYPGDGDVDWALHNTDPERFLRALELSARDAGAEVSRHPSAVMIHLRLGDFLWPRAAARYGILKEGYFLEALNELELRDWEIHLVTEDRRAVRRLYPRLWKAAAQIRPVGSPWQDLLALSSGAALLSANSTFSLWAAWIGWARDDTFSAVSPNPLLRNGAYKNFTLAHQREASYWEPRDLIVRHPWVLSRRLRWQPAGWL